MIVAFTTEGLSHNTYGLKIMLIIIIMLLVDHFTSMSTELGGIALSPLAGCSDGKLKPGFCRKPFFGVEPLIVDTKVQCLAQKVVITI